MDLMFTVIWFFFYKGQDIFLKNSPPLTLYIYTFLNNCTYITFIAVFYVYVERLQEGRL
jgi:hypothetical protein